MLNTRGKGDYYRLGHGTDDHVRRPRKVAALQGKKVISIATGKTSVIHNRSNPQKLLYQSQMVKLSIEK